ncbi:MAG: TatD family hydrolase [Clostridia bacterium]|nr:TatD family hydrolase [Clostridia bacterium]
MLFDTHAHLLAEQFEADRAEVLARFKGEGVTLYLEAGTTAADSAKAIEWAQAHEGVFAGAGIHPHEAGEANAADIDALAGLLQKEKCVALGEIGLDYHYDFSPRDVQKQVFEAQLCLAAAQKVPVVIHDREAHGDMLAMLSAFKGRVYGVMHCYSGSVEDAKRLLDMGYYISFSGSVTFKNAARLPEVAAYVPHDRILAETDSPYMAPVPKRGQRNNPGNVRLVVEKLAALRGIGFEQMAAQTRENGKRLFGIGDN